MCVFVENFVCQKGQDQIRENVRYFNKIYNSI